jgi:hypothetical protein
VVERTRPKVTSYVRCPSVSLLFTAPGTPLWPNQWSSGGREAGVWSWTLFGLVRMYRLHEVVPVLHLQVSSDAPNCQWQFAKHKWHCARKMLKISNSTLTDPRGRHSTLLWIPMRWLCQFWNWLSWWLLVWMDWREELKTSPYPQSLGGTPSFSLRRTPENVAFRSTLQNGNSPWGIQSAVGV